jgi:two-component system, response regulator
MLLLVEDNPADIDLAKRAFSKHKFVNSIEVARDGQEALDFMFGMGNFAHRDLSHMPRVILLDLKLPKISGLHVLKEIKTDERTRRTPVVMLTSSREPRDVIEAYGLGANSYIVKPVNFDEFLKVSKQLGMYWLTLNEALPLD